MDNMGPTDEELDRDWKPNGRRPQSTLARSFSQELMDIFKIENSVADLDEKVDKRKQVINTQASELESLEARIREMEDRLRRSQMNSHARRPLSQLHTEPPRKEDQAAPAVPPKEAAEDKARSRPNTARSRQAPSSGAMPPTPSASEDGNDDQRE